MVARPHSSPSRENFLASTEIGGWPELSFRILPASITNASTNTEMKPGRIRNRIAAKTMPSRLMQRFSREHHVGNQSVAQNQQLVPNFPAGGISGVKRIRSFNAELGCLAIVFVLLA